jgi:hypothetical protein
MTWILQIVRNFILWTNNYGPPRHSICTQIRFARMDLTNQLKYVIIWTIKQMDTSYFNLAWKKYLRLLSDWYIYNRLPCIWRLISNILHKSQQQLLLSYMKLRLVLRGLSRYLLCESWEFIGIKSYLFLACTVNNSSDYTLWSLYRSYF